MPSTTVLCIKESRTAILAYAIQPPKAQNFKDEEFQQQEAASKRSMKTSIASEKNREICSESQGVILDKNVCRYSIKHNWKSKKETPSVLKGKSCILSIL